MALPLTVRSAPSDDPNTRFWEVASPYRSAVELEVLRLQSADDVVVSEFHRPWREPGADGGPQWRATGFITTNKGGVK